MLNQVVLVGRVKSIQKFEDKPISLCIELPRMIVGEEHISDTPTIYFHKHTPDIIRNEPRVGDLVSIKGQLQTNYNVHTDLYEPLVVVIQRSQVLRRDTYATPISDT
jgi:hypothetical protein